MSRYEINITEPAERDLYEIGLYISKELLEPEISKKVLTKLYNVIFSLEVMPLRNPLVADERLAHLGMRKILMDNYIIFYIIDSKNRTVTIVRILYTRRDWISLI